MRAQHSTATVIILLLSVMTVGFLAVKLGETAQAQVDGGATDVDTNDLLSDGTISNPYEISSVSQLQAIKGNLNANYEFVSDVNASDTAQFNDGSGFDPVGEFTGSLDGSGHTITGLIIDRSSRDDVGLFERNSGTVANVTLTEATVVSEFTVGGFELLIPATSLNHRPEMVIRLNSLLISHLPLKILWICLLKLI